jgi:hypothetical protein
MAKLANVKLSVDAEELDRLAIGGRIYDKFNLSNAYNIFKVKDGELVIYEKDIENIVNLINEPMSIKPKKISVIKGD